MENTVPVAVSSFYVLIRKRKKSQSFFHFHSSIVAKPSELFLRELAAGLSFTLENTGSIIWCTSIGNEKVFDPQNKNKISPFITCYSVDHVISGTVLILANDLIYST